MNFLCIGLIYLQDAQTSYKTLSNMFEFPILLLIRIDTFYALQIIEKSEQNCKK